MPIAGAALEEYLRRARAALKEPRLKERWEEQALITLHEQGGVVESALAMLSLEEDLVKEELWGEEEEEALVSALRSLGANDLQRLHAKLQTQRGLGSIVAHAYLKRPLVTSHLDDVGELPLSVMRPRRAKEQWACETCTILNERRFKICQMCRIGQRPPAGGAAPESAAGEASGSVQKAARHPAQRRSVAPPCRRRAEEARCEVCGSGAFEERMLLCDSCDRGFHMDCLQPPLGELPEGDWFCGGCVRRSNSPGKAGGRKAGGGNAPAAMFEVQSIQERRSGPGGDEFLVRWCGYDSSHDSWQPRSNLYCTELLAAFERAAAPMFNDHAAGGASAEVKRPAAPAASRGTKRERPPGPYVPAGYVPPRADANGSAPPPAKREKAVAAATASAAVVGVTASVLPPVPPPVDPTVEAARQAAAAAAAARRRIERGTFTRPCCHLPRPTFAPLSSSGSEGGGGGGSSGGGGSG